MGRGLGLHDVSARERSEPLVENDGLYGVRLVVRYEGTAFAGYQEQPGQRTVQGVLQEAAERIAGRAVKVRGASRTDAGVHAEGQVVAFDSARLLEPERWALALNRYLPDDVAVRSVEPCAVGYAPRFDAVHKTYRYLLHVGPFRDPLTRTHAWHLGRQTRGLRGPLKLDAMRQAAAQLVGTHDFKAFRAADDEREMTVRTLHALEVDEAYQGNPELIALVVNGSAFMKNMVRILTGTLLEVGLGRMTPGAVSALLAPEAQRSAAGPTAPAHGLTLVSMVLGRATMNATRGPASPTAP
jgi:tRNA pseudouridine38-40 synthase